MSCGTNRKTRKSIAIGLILYSIKKVRSTPMRKWLKVVVKVWKIFPSFRFNPVNISVSSGNNEFNFKLACFTVPHLPFLQEIIMTERMLVEI